MGFEARLSEYQQQAKLGGGEVKRFFKKKNKFNLYKKKARIKAQHAKGKLTARERVELLLDKGMFIQNKVHVSYK